MRVCILYIVNSVTQVAGALDFMKYTYGVFGFEFELDLSTRPKKALGSLDVWNNAEAMMKEALDAFGRWVKHYEALQ